MAAHPLAPHAPQMWCYGPGRAVLQGAGAESRVWNSMMPQAVQGPRRVGRPAAARMHAPSSQATVLTELCISIPAQRAMRGVAIRLRRLLRACAVEGLQRCESRALEARYHPRTTGGNRVRAAVDLSHYMTPSGSGEFKRRSDSRSIEILCAAPATLISIAAGSRERSASAVWRAAIWRAKFAPSRVSTGAIAKSG